MIRKLLGRFKETPQNPCLGWPSLKIETPSVDTSIQQIGPLRIGDPIEKAKVLGTPDQVSPLEGNALNLIYAKAGFQLEFDQNLLTSIAYFISADQFNPTCSNLTFSTPVINTIQLDESHDVGQIESLFGKPSSRDEDPEEIILYYLLHDLTAEFEFSDNRKLKRINIYRTKTTSG